MTTTEILQIIEGCKGAGIAEFSHDGLNFKFLRQQDAVEDPVITKKQLEENEFRQKMAELENLRLTDPLQYEELLANDAQPGA